MFSVCFFFGFVSSYVFVAPFLSRKKTVQFSRFLRRRAAEHFEVDPRQARHQHPTASSERQGATRRSDCPSDHGRVRGVLPAAGFQLPRGFEGVLVMFW